MSGGRVLVRLPSWLGDLVQTEPALATLAHAFGEQALTLAGPATLLPVLDGCLPAARRLGHAGRGGERARAWRDHGLAVLFTNSFRSAWVAWRAGIPRRVGWERDGRAWLLTDAMRPALERGAAPLGVGRPGGGCRFLPRPFGSTCVELLGLLGLSVARTRPRLAPTEQARARAAERLVRLGVEGGAPYLVANVGARPGSAKGVPPELWAAVLDALPSEWPVVLVAGPGEEAATAAVTAACGRARPRVAGPETPDLPELAALFAQARCVLTGDSGPRHLARALGRPVVCVAGPSDPRHSAEHLEHERVARRRVPCGPCHRERCDQRGADELRCMRSIDPAHVAALTHGLLQ